ncbi:MAG: polysaccharide biosynthesis C-terminal domain-containing protein [Lachnospiraceae bacterium]|nr:polysaccharide biosynthesis C-terminal domain-containing protein [Lachnospiraceae bacterium]
MSNDRSPSKYRYFAGNLALFTISNFVSKILVFLLVPFYTNVLSTTDYGIADVMQTTLLLLVPALTINMGEAALRYGIDRSDKRREILKTGLRFVMTACLITAAGCALGCIFVRREIRWYLFLFIFLFLTNSLYEFLILFFQGCERVKTVVCGSVFSTVILIISNIVFLLVVKIGLNGYLLSQMLAFAFASVLMLILGHKAMPDVVTLKKDGLPGTGDEGSIEKELISYGVPMIAYSTGSWINNAADRYLVSFIKGVAVNGIYGVAYKIPAILTVFQRIFAQSWQMSAVKSYKESHGPEEAAGFFSEMYSFYNAFMAAGCSFLILIVRVLALLMFKKDFHEAWRFVPPLLISVVFGALTGFLGSICLAYKDSKAMGFATGIGASVNIVLNLMLIPAYGAMGAAVATAVSYYLMFFIAYIKVSGHVKLNVRLIRDHIVYILLILEAVIMICGEGTGASLRSIYMITAGILILILIIYRNEEKRILTGLTATFRKGRE